MDVGTVETTTPTVAVVWQGGASRSADAPTGESSDRFEGPNAPALPPAAESVVAESVPALSSLLGDSAVDCVVTSRTRSPDGSEDLAALLDAVEAYDPDLPVVVATADPAPEAAATIAGRPAAHHVPAASDDAVQAVLEHVVETYDRHRQDARERAMFREVLELAPLAIYLKDEEGRHVAASSVAEQGVEGSVLGKTDVELFGDDLGLDPDPAELPPEELPRSYRDDLQVLESGVAVEDADERIEVTGGESLWMRTTKVPRRDDGDVVGLLGFTRDISAEKRREQELERETRRLEQFASFASHDLRNPLMVADGHIELARETGDDAHLDAVDDALDRMESLIDDLLEIAQPESDHEEEWVELAAVVERAWAAVDATDASLTIDVPAAYEVRAASGALRQLLENILRNSVDHGGPDVAIEVGSTDTGFYVADDGPGIPEADRESVFEYGFTTGGSGIGLAIAAEIADAHGWTYAATECESGGAHFAFDRCLTRLGDAEPPIEGDRLALGDWRTVGDPAVAGDVTDEGDGRITIRGGGRALWGDVEEYACYATDVEGGVRIEGRLVSVESVHEYSKAGLVLADATEPGRRLGFVGKTADHGTEAAWRTEVDGPVETQQAEPDATVPRWYRIDRLGGRIRFYGSTDRETWTMIDQHVLSLADPVAVGLLVNSHEAGTTCAATFEDVRVVGLEESGSDGE